MRPLCIVFFSEGIPFTGETVFNRCLGGMESSLIYMAQELAKRGHDVSVFNSSTAESTSRDVKYYPLDSFSGWKQIRDIDVAVSCRTFAPLRVPFNPKLFLYWTGDAWNQPFVEPLKNPEIRNRFDYIVLKSQWQMQTFVSHLGVPADQCWVTRNGFNADYYRDLPDTRNRHRLIYTSTPYRGLDVLLDMFPRIRKEEPDIELHLFSSMKVYNYTSKDDTALFGDIYKKAKQPGVYLHKSIPQPELARELMQSGIMVYPNHFEETSCVAAIEAQAAGVPVVTSKLAALAETVAHGQSGLLVPGDSHSAEYQNLFIDKVLTLLRNEQMFDEISANARKRAFDQYSWQTIAEEWEHFFYQNLTTPCRRYLDWFIKTGDYPTLLNVIEQAIEQGYRSPDLMLLAASLYIKFNNPQNAQLVLEDLLRDEPDNPEILCRLGEVFCIQGDESEGMRYFRTALDIDPDYEHALFQVAAIYESKGYLRKALSIYRKCLDHHSEHSPFAKQKIQQITSMLQKDRNGAPI